MAADIGVKIGIEGAAQFKQSLATVNSELKSLSAEMKAATAEFKGNENSSEALAKKSDILARSMDAAKEKIAILSSEYEKQSGRLDELGAALDEAKAQYGENSSEVEKAERAFSQQEQTVNKLAAQLHNAEADLYGMQNAESELGTTAEETTPKVSTFGDTLKAKLAGEAIIAGIKGIANGIVDVGKAMLNSAKETASYADNVNTLATQYNLTTDQVQEFLYMEDLADVSFNTIAGSLTKLTKNMGEAQSGTGAASDAFVRLGVSVTNSDGTLRTSQEVFMDTVEALGKVENATDRDTLAMDIFGKSAQDLNPLIALGADGFADLAAEAHEAGYVMGEDALEGAQKFQDGMDRASKKADALKRELGAALAPALETIIDLALKWAEKIDWEKVGSVISGVFEWIGGAIEAVIPYIESMVSWAQDNLAPAFEAVMTAAKPFLEYGWAVVQSTVTTVFNAIASAIGAVVSALQSIYAWAQKAIDKLKGLKMPNLNKMSGDELITLAPYATGYYDVPYDNYPARLHAGEMVLTASEARTLRAGGMGGSTVNIYTQQLDEATVDYVVRRVNVSLGAAV